MNLDDEAIKTLAERLHEKEWKGDWKDLKIILAEQHKTTEVRLFIQSLRALLSYHVNNHFLPMNQVESVSALFDRAILVVKKMAKVYENCTYDTDFSKGKMALIFSRPNAEGPEVEFFVESKSNQKGVSHWGEDTLVIRQYQSEIPEEERMVIIPSRPVSVQPVKGE